MKAIKKPIEIEYYPCELDYLGKIMEWSTKERPISMVVPFPPTMELNITTLEWVHRATIKDVIIKWINWEVYPCKKDIFYKTYDIIEKS